MKLTYKNWTFQGGQTESVKIAREQSLDCTAISADILTVTVRCDDSSILNFKKSDPVRFWPADDALTQTYYVQKIKRAGSGTYQITAWSAVTLLTAIPHAGGIYTGETAEEVIKSICGSIPVIIESVYANKKLYGWLPYCAPPEKSARDNLAQVLLAIGAYLRTDLNGALRIEKLWNGVASSVEAPRMYRGGSSNMDDRVSAVVVTEHQYIAGTSVVSLFEGTAESGTLVTFSEPIHSLTATGFSILESGANYAKISAGTGTLTGKKYVHNTRLVTKTVDEEADENVKSITNKTLVSLVNSEDVASRLAEYYACRETIDNPIIAGAERAGHIVSIYHPYDEEMVSACIESLDSTISGITKSAMKALVGYTPPQPDASQYYDQRIVLTGSGSFTVPENCTSLRAVCIGAGQGGKCGQPGDAPTWKTSTESQQWTDSLTYSRKVVGFYKKDLPPASGGDPGEGGAPGKVYAQTLTVEPGQVIAYASGVGGEGGAYEPATSPEGTLGTASTFGDLSSDDGSSTDTGYYDTVTGELFATRGILGVPGGDGVGYVENASGEYVESVPEDIVVDGVHYTAGTRGTARVTDSGGNASASGSWSGDSTCGFGGGPAYKANGGNTTEAGGVYGSSRSQYAAASSGIPGAGADAQPPEKSAVYGCGGRGGNGGGGAGQVGWGTNIEATVNSESASSISDWDLRVAVSNEIHRGLGSAGGEGADGCIIVYLRVQSGGSAGALKTSDGKWFLDRLGRRFIV